ncbi:MAG: lipopolysaccharide biosynthesis protein [Pseudomonadota bacterium]|nr:lipopolysaccharide biosynthesis protein [Pseudomonadota bacterium]
MHRQAPASGWLALKWNYIGNILRSLSQFAIGILLARMLGPEPFGIVAIAWIVLGIANLVADLGFGAALVQRAELAPSDVQFIFTCQMAFAVLLTLIGVGSAAALAASFHKPEATLVIQAMFLLFVFQALGQTAAAMLRRALNFKTLQQITIASYLAGYLCVGIPAAYAGLGVWSLVAAQAVQVLLNAFLLIYVTRMSLRLCFRPNDPTILRFGVKVTAANLSSWAISNLDVVLIGRAFGAVDLGLYNRVLNLVNMPMSIITTGFQGVLFAACARAQRDRDAVRRIYLETNAAVAVLCFPIFLTAALVPETLVLALYGPLWGAAVPVVTPLALAVLVNALLAIKGPILMAADRVDVELRNQLFTVLMFVPALVVAIEYTLAAVAWAVLLTYIARWLLLAIATLRLTGASVGEYAATFRTPLLFGACVSVTAMVADRSLALLVPSLGPLLRLFSVAALAALVLLGLVRLRGGHFVTACLGTLVKPASLSGPVRKLLKV